MLPTGAVVREDSAPWPPHPQVVFYSFSVLLTGVLVGVQRFAFLGEQVSLYFTVHTACFHRVSGKTCVASSLQKWVVVWLLKSNSGLCISCILWELERALPLHSHSWAPESARTWHFGGASTIWSDIKTVSAGYRGMRFDSQNKCLLFPFLMPGLVEGTHLEGRIEVPRRNHRGGTTY